MSDGFYRFQLGAFECVVLFDASFVNKASWFFKYAPDADERDSALRERGVDPDAVPSNFMPFYINTGTHRVLIDTGNGGSDSHLSENMAAAGIDPQSIDTVIHTHNHVDHVAGNCETDGKPNFPNARFCIPKMEWDYWSAEEVTIQHIARGTPIRQRNVYDLKDRFTLLDGAGEVVPGIRAVTAYGHTPGHIALLIESAGQKLLHVADALHQPQHTEFPDWSAGFDMIPATAAEARRKLMHMAAKDNLLMFVYHFPFPGLGHVVEKGATWLWQPLIR
jgi:glyoxylase-like metal-dependent hydrolase (beta-lactamase superfamily II)